MLRIFNPKGIFAFHKIFRAIAWCVVFLLCQEAGVYAQQVPDGLKAIMKILEEKDRVLGVVGLQPKVDKVTHSPEIFSAQMDIDVQEKKLSMTIRFFRKSSTIEQQTIVGYGMTSYFSTSRLVYPFVPMTSVVVEQSDSRWLVYDNGTDVIAFKPTMKDQETLQLKEWIYARSPNSPTGSHYEWAYGFMGRAPVLESMEQDRVGLYAEMLINGIDNDDRAKRQHILDTVKKAIPNTYIFEKPLVGVLEPVTYWTSDGLKKKARFVIKDRKNLIIEINEPKSNYPLVIEN